MNLETQIRAELWSAVRVRWENRDFSGAVLDAMYFLSDMIRQKGDLEGDGVSLVGQAFGGSNPRIKVTRLRTETDRNVQAGTEAILRGMYQAIRNPRSHEKMKDSEGDAFAVIIFLDYMIRVVGEARSVFSEQSFLERVFDDDFVAEERYAKLLVEEVPTAKCLEVALEVFRQRNHGKGEHLSLLFEQLIPRLEHEERSDFYREVSDDLRTEDDEARIRLAVQMIPPDQWNLIEEVARLRIENKFVKSIRVGRYDPRSGKCLAGAFGTWGRRVLERSSLLEKAKQMLIRNLRSDDQFQRAYVLEYFFSWLCDLPDMPSRALELAVKSRLSEGDSELKSAAEVQFMFDKERDWSDVVKEALEAFVAVEPQPNLSEPDDDLPF